MKLPSKKVVAIIVIILLLIAGTVAWRLISDNNSIGSFDECAAAGNPVMESYPEQCSTNGHTYANPRQRIESVPAE
jgi:hypothetical protein